MDDETRVAKTGGLSSIGANGFVSEDDVLFLRRNVYPDGRVDRSELLAIFDLAQRAPDGDPQWPSLFAEIAADYFLNEEEPRGYVTPGEFTDLKALIEGRDATSPNALHGELLVSLLGKAISTPPAMADFTAETIAGAIAAKPGGARIDARDADLVRRFLYAAGGAGAVGVTRDEVEWLFDLHDLTVEADNDPAWLDLFIKAVAAHLMQYVGYEPLPREEALRLDAWAEDASTNVGGFFQRMFDGGLAAVRDAYSPRRKSGWAAKIERDEVASEIAERVTAQEADWLANRIARNGRADGAEKALIAYMRDLNADLPPKLRALAGDDA